MVRRYGDLIEVRTALADERGASSPVAFIWRDRLYVVRSVLSHWYERRVWWREAAASALLGLRSETAFTAQGAVATAPARVDEGRPDEPRAPLEPAEREVWRVEAAAGRSSPVGVYDLVYDPSGHGSSGSSGWRLARLDD